MSTKKEKVEFEQAAFPSKAQATYVVESNAEQQVPFLHVEVEPS